MEWNPTKLSEVRQSDMPWARKLHFWWESKHWVYILLALRIISTSSARKFWLSPLFPGTSLGTETNMCDAQGVRTECEQNKVWKEHFYSRLFWTLESIKTVVSTSLSVFGLVCLLWTRNIADSYGRGYKMNSIKTQYTDGRGGTYIWGKRMSSSRLAWTPSQTNKQQNYE